MPRETIVAQPILNGQPLPDFRLSSTEDKPVTLSDVERKKGVVLAFIHGTWCPYCTRQLLRLKHYAADIYKAEVGLVCITHDSTDSMAAYYQSLQPSLGYTLLMDTEPSIAHQYGVYDADHDSPYPTVFYADSSRIVRYSDVSSDPDCFPNMQRLMEVIEDHVKPDKK